MSSSSSDDSEVDLSWIYAEQRLLESKTMYTREPVTRMAVWMLFVSNTDEDWNDIHKIHATSLSLSPSVQHVSIDRIQTLVDSYREKHSRYASYEWKELLLYHVPIEANEILAYSQSDPHRSIHHWQSVWTPESNVSEISIPASIFVFQDIHALYCILEEPKAIPLDPVVDPVVDPVIDPVVDPEEPAEESAPLPEEDEHDSEEDESDVDTTDDADEIPIPARNHTPLLPILKHTSKQKPSIRHGLTKKVRINTIPQIILQVKPKPKHTPLATKPKGKMTRKYIPSKSINTTVQ
jgi:hypothetical protein